MSKDTTRDNWETPPDFWAWVERRFRPTIDICATAENAKCDDYVTPEGDSLGNPWTSFISSKERADARIWCNPGYSDLGPWVERAVEAQRDGLRVIMLTHDNWSAEWFRRLYYGGFSGVLLRPRLKFIPPPGVEASSPARCNILWLSMDRWFSFLPRGDEPIRWFDWERDERMNLSGENLR